VFPGELAFSGGLRPRFRLVWVSISAGFVALGCGAKDIGESPWRGTGLSMIPALSELPVGAECNTDAECHVADKCSPRACVAGACVLDQAPNCNDADPCTADGCDPQTGACTFEVLTEDRDGDGQRALLVTVKPGEIPASCFTDCDDSRVEVGPFASEICDGIDNNCDGVVDEGFNYLTSTRTPVLVSTNSRRADFGGIAFDGTHYVVSLAEALENNQTELVALDATGELIYNEPVARTNSDSYPGGVHYVNGALAMAWDDRRDDDFEIYFNRFDRSGQKLGPDLRVSNAPGFSLGANLLALDTGYVVTWGDRRAGDQDFRIYGQRVSLDSTLETPENVNLTPDISKSESPSVARGATDLGLVFNSEQGDLQIYFRTVSQNLDTLGPLTFVATGVGPSITYIKGAYYVFWHQYGVTPGDAIWGTVLSPAGEVVVAPERVTAPAPFARGHSVLNLGDRMLLAWAEYHGEQYDVWQQTFDLALKPLTQAQQVTSGEGDALAPDLALGAGGEIGVAYGRHAAGQVEVWFSTLACQ
jgi:Putative metal-binding motif